MESSTFASLIIVADLLILTIAITVLYHKQAKTPAFKQLKPGSILEYKTTNKYKQKRAPQIVIETSDGGHYLTRIKSRDNRKISRKLYRLAMSDVPRFFNVNHD